MHPVPPHHHLPSSLSLSTIPSSSLTSPLCQVRQLFPSARACTLLWHSVVKIGQSLYQEAPGMDPYRPDQKTPVPNFFLAGSYTKQDYIDSMEGATLSGGWVVICCALCVCGAI